MTIPWSKNTIIVLCGLPGSGKSTMSKKIANEQSAKLYSLDELRTSKGESTDRIIMYQNIVDDLINGKDIVCDDLNIRLVWRQKLLSALQGIPCKKILIVMTTPLEECIRRNAQRQGQARLPDSAIYHLNQRYQPPSLDEGWDDIQYI